MLMQYNLLLVLMHLVLVTKLMEYLGVHVRNFMYHNTLPKFYSLGVHVSFIPYYNTPAKNNSLEVNESYVRTTTLSLNSNLLPL